MTACVTDSGARRRWMSILAKAGSDDLEVAWTELGAPASYRIVRGPEIGLVMVRGRAGGTGARFNLGEMTVTRCTVQLDDGTVGHAYVSGGRRRHAELAAALDAMLQDPARRVAGEAGVVVERLAKAQADRRRTAEARAAATRVEFLTLVRGEE